MNTRTLAACLALACLLVLAVPAYAQEKAQPPAEELEVTMTIIVDPDSKLPEAVVRRIKLPPPPARPAEAGPPRDGNPVPGEGERPPARAGEEFGKEVSERAREMAREAAEDREDLGRSIAEEARRNAPPPDELPGPPTVPPGRP